MKKIWLTLKYLWFGFILGMKRAEDETLHQKGNELDVGTIINQGVHENSVAKALLRGELTQEVIDLRYRTYAVAREASHYNYFSPTLAKKKGDNDYKFIKVSNDDNRTIVTVQENKLQVETLTDSLERIGSDGKYVKRDNEYNIKFSRSNDFTPRFLIEDFVKKVVVFEGDDKWSAIVDLYVSKYPDNKNIQSKPFITSIERVIKIGTKFDALMIDTIEFETYKAYRLDDMYHFKFGDLQLSKIFEYDGDYVIEFVTNIIDGGTDLSEEFYSEKMAKKYENKEKKDTCINFDPDSMIRVYKCADCGREVTYDARALDALKASDIATDGSTTEYLDYEMAEYEFGRMLCKNCVRKEQERLYKQMYNKEV